MKESLIGTTENVDVVGNMVLEDRWIVVKWLSDFENLI